MKDYRVQVKVKNNRILRAIEDAGYKTCGAFCVATGLSSSEIGNYINFKKSPLLKSGEWSVRALRLAEILRTTPDHLFSEVQKELQLRTNAAERTFTAIQMFGLPDDSPDALLLRDQSTDMVHKILESKLNGRQLEVITLRYGLDGSRPKTLEEIAVKTDVKRERVRQIEAQSLRKLRFGAGTVGDGTDDDPFIETRELMDIWESCG